MLYDSLAAFIIETFAKEFDIEIGLNKQMGCYEVVNLHNIGKFLLSECPLNFGLGII